MTTPNSQRITALYERLSKDDDVVGDSNSILNQKKILEDYAAKNGFLHCAHYTDDGYSGGSFNRPAWKKLIRDVEAGIVQTVIAKDMSRVGRNYLETGYYTEVFFRRHEVRFFAITYGVDSEDHSSEEFAPFLNIMNEWYLRDCSRKMRTTYQLKSKAGKLFTNNVIYGYMNSPDEKGKWIIDPEAAAVVRRIFELRAKGLGMITIAKILNDEKIPSPSAYYYMKIGKPNTKSLTDLWCRTSVRRILKNPIYIGTLAQMRDTTVSYKNHQRIHKDKEDWIVIEHNHEPIISQELWDKAQEYDASVSRGKQDHRGIVSIFSGLLYCHDCGYKMKQVWLNRKRDVIGYSCGHRIRYGKNYCSTHTIRGSVLEALVIADIQSKLQLIVDEDKARKQFLEKKSGVRSSQTASDAKRKREIEHRLSELDTLTQSVYENMVLGKVPEEVCLKLLEKYLAENKDLQTEATAIQERLDAANQDEQDVNEFIRRLKKYAGVEVLTREMLLELVEYITIEETPESRNIPRKIHIYYKFLDKALSNKQNALL